MSDPIIAHSQSLCRTHLLNGKSTLSPSLYQLQSSFEEVVIVGAGMAGSRLAVQLATAWQSIQSRQTPVRITLISKEPEVGYNRIMLSPVLAGETAFDDTYLYDKGEYERLGIKVMSGVSVDHIDTNSQLLKLNDGQVLSYAKLILATGSKARVIPLPNHDAKNVHVFREVSDMSVLRDYAKQGKKGLVIGGGVLGVEAACALASQGAKMSVIHVDRYVLNRQLDLTAAVMLQQELTKRQVRLELSAMSSAIEINKTREVTGLTLKDGRTLKADFIVMAVGIIPNTKLAKDSGIEVNRGIVVDNYMRTSCDNVYAIGECVEINEELFGMVSSVNQHVETLKSVMIHQASPSQWQPFVSAPLSLKLKVSGVAVFSAGQIQFKDTEREGIEKIIYRQFNSNHYQCLYIRNNFLIGVVLYGETSDGNFYSQLINDEIDISDIKDSLIYGAAYCGSVLEASSHSIHEIDNGAAAVTIETDIIEDGSMDSISPLLRSDSSNGNSLSNSTLINQQTNGVRA